VPGINFRFVSGLLVNEPSLSYSPKVVQWPILSTVDLGNT
jgi:hypothetical protein